MSSPLNRKPNGEADRRRLLVSLCLLSVQYWQESTLTSKVELATQSELWTVSLDRGSPQTRTLDRYMNFRSIPRRPNVETVLRTTYFVLDQCKGKSPLRRQLEASLKVFLDLEQKLRMS